MDDFKPEVEVTCSFCRNGCIVCQRPQPVGVNVYPPKSPIGPEEAWHKEIIDGLQLAIAAISDWDKRNSRWPKLYDLFDQLMVLTEAYSYE